MSSYLDSIPQAVADIVSACFSSSLAAAAKSQPDRVVEEMENRIVNLTDRLTRTFAKALRDAEEAK